VADLDKVSRFVGYFYRERGGSGVEEIEVFF
jgi:hypothetical protein